MTDTKACIIHLSLTFVSPKEIMEDVRKLRGFLYGVFSKLKLHK